MTAANPLTDGRISAMDDDQSRGNSREILEAKAHAWDELRYRTRRIILDDNGSAFEHREALRIMHDLLRNDDLPAPKPPREIAEEIVTALDGSDIAGEDEEQDPRVVDRIAEIIRKALEGAP